MVQSFPEQYKTLDGLSKGLYKEKGSKFIAYAVACRSEEEVRYHLIEWKKVHPQARQLCYAYRLKPDMSIFRANDDGEPSNSAGVPILNQIRSYELTNVLVGVICYFGGSKLGVAGLVNAYKEASKDALSNAEIVDRTVMHGMVLRFTYRQMPEIMSAIKQLGLEINRSEFNEDCFVEIAVPIRKLENVCMLFGKMNEVNVEELGII